MRRCDVIVTRAAEQTVTGWRLVMLLQYRADSQFLLVVKCRSVAADGNNH